MERKNNMFGFILSRTKWILTGALGTLALTTGNAWYWLGVVIILFVITSIQMGLKDETCI